jgi:hypothetical protein
MLNGTEHGTNFEADEVLCCELCGSAVVGDECRPVAYSEGRGLWMACPACVAERDARVANNPEADEDEVDLLRAAWVGDTVSLAIGGGFVTVKRVS